MIRTAFVFGAGFGTRLRPLTEGCPKPLLPVGGRPLITWAFDHSLTAGVRRFIVNTHYCAAAYGEAFPEGRWRGAPILFRYEPVLLDTAGGLKNVEDLLDDGPLLVYNGDILSDLPLSRLLAAHAAGGVEVTLALRSDGPLRNVALDASGVVCDLRGLLGNPGVRHCQFTGISVVERRFLARLVPGRVASTIPHLAELIRERPGSVGGAVIDAGTWLDIGDRESYGRIVDGVTLAYERGSGAPAGTDTPIHTGGGAASRPADAVEGAGGARGQGGSRQTSGRRSVASRPRDDALERREQVAAAPDRAALRRETFVRRALDLPADGVLTLTPVGRGGSDRRYWRITLPGRPTVLLMHYGRLYPENDRWPALADFLAKAGLSVPALYARDRRCRLLLLEDLGDGDLYALRDEPWETRRPLYEKTLTLAARLHALPSISLPKRLARMPDYDAGLYRWERDYFRERLVRDVCGIALTAGEAKALERELQGLAAGLLAGPACLIHRDLQSQNVMLRAGEPVLIDFQGLRRGHPGYDLASLLWDPYVTFPAGAREALLCFYREQARRLGADVPGEAAFDRAVWRAAVQRLMQALGAYGFLGLQRGKPHFLSYIPRALENLLAVAAQGGDLPRLHTLVRRCRRRIAEGRSRVPAVDQRP